MNQVLRSVLELVRRLQPVQTNSGSNSVQVGQAGGDVNVNNSQNSVTINVAPAATPGLATHEQREVLRRIREMPWRRNDIFAFMAEEFNTSLVISLSSPELERLGAFLSELEQSKAG